MALGIVSIPLPSPLHKRQHLNNWEINLKNAFTRNKYSEKINPIRSVIQTIYTLNDLFKSILMKM